LNAPGQFTEIEQRTVDKIKDLAELQAYLRSVTLDDLIVVIASEFSSQLLFDTPPYHLNGPTDAVFSPDLLPNLPGPVLHRLVAGRYDDTLGQVLGGQFLPGYRFGADTHGLDPFTPKQLVLKMRHQYRGQPGPQTGGGCACPAVMHHRRHPGKEPVVGHGLQ
jgi:hypothetical protein